MFDFRLDRNTYTVLKYCEVTIIESMNLPIMGIELNINMLILLTSDWSCYSGMLLIYIIDIIIYCLEVLYMLC